MKLFDFDFDFDRQLIATEQVKPRSSSRLLHVLSHSFEDLFFYNLENILQAGDLLVFNNSKVIPSKLSGFRGNACINIQLHKQLKNTWMAFIRPAKRVSIGDKIIIGDDFFAEILNKYDGEVELLFNQPSHLLNNYLLKYGNMPLPHYIKRAVNSEDNISYQTIYAKIEGSVASPTAGLHFTEDLINRLQSKFIDHVFVTLHVGAGTFLPVKTENIEDHKMHSEYYIINKEAANKINNTKKNGGRIIAVGTTSLRVLESAAIGESKISEFKGETNIFIKPGYKFKIPDILITNFHLPKTTLFMLVCAFAGMERMKNAYKYAIDNKYRFFSYGDSSIIYRDEK